MFLKYERVGASYQVYVKYLYHGMSLKVLRVAMKIFRDFKILPT